MVTKYWYFVSESAEIVAVFISGEIALSSSFNALIEKLSKILNEKGETKISIQYQNEGKTLIFELENPRKVDHKSLNSLKNDKIHSIMD